MSISTPEAPTEVPVAEAEKPAVDSMFKWSEWVHLGVGAEECGHAKDGKCADPEHFHAWVRLPNPYQIRDIQEKSRAAQARYRRMLKDPESDQRVILEDELPDPVTAVQDLLIREIVDKNFPEDYAAAVRDVDEIEDESYTPEGDEDIPRLYANIDQDQEEFQRRVALPEEERGEDFEELQRTVAAYADAVESAMEARQKPRRDALAEKSVEELIDVIRRDRMEHKATEVYLHTYNTWQWYTCTYKFRPNNRVEEKRYWDDVHTMQQTVRTEEIGAIRAAFDGLEQNLAASRRGKGS